jgi:hypothetical protein
MGASIFFTAAMIRAPMFTCVWQKLEYSIDVCSVTRGAHIERLQLSKKKCFRFPVAVKNSITVGHLVFLLQMFAITGNIMKRPDNKLLFHYVDML